METQLLIEILTEELPALPFLKEWDNIPKKWQASLSKYNICAHFEIHFTPRRICLYANDFPTTTKDSIIELFGPPLHIAYNGGKPENGLSKAGESFLKKAHISIENLKTTIKDSKEVLYAKNHIAGVQTDSLISEIVKNFLESLQFGKAMRWGSNKESFIRPIRNVLILLGDRHISPKYFGQQGRQATLLHRDLGYEWIPITSLNQYLQTLQNGGIILDYEERKKRILAQIKQIEKREQCEVGIDEDLLNEIGAITEYPTALLGRFDEEFLHLPSEVIITSMKENQRYFGIYKNKKLYNGFIVVANSMTKDFSLIISGNQKVLKARLSDAAFFYANDLKNPLSSEPLAKVAFVDGLGSLLDKTKREEDIGAYLAQKYNIDSALIVSALNLSKADLLSEMVGEFPELQGIMGYYYALAQTKDERLALAIKEQYLPNGEDSPLPSTKENAIVAMSAKLDSLLALFSIGKIPSGSKDPFALRRAANGVIRIILEFDLDFDVESDLAHLAKLQHLGDGYVLFDVAILRDFLLERLESILKLDGLIFRSVIMGATKQITAIAKNAKALESLLHRPDKEELVSLFKRVANITKDMQQAESINEAVLIQPQEKALFQAYKHITQQTFKNPESLLEALFGLKSLLGEFFDNVMVNDHNEQIRQNRKALVFAIYLEFKKIGDLKELAI